MGPARKIINLIRILSGIGALAALLAVSVSPVLAADTDQLTPVTAMPAIGNVAADDYYVLLLNWSRDVRVGALNARITYLDPRLYLSWLKSVQGEAITQSDLDGRLSGFPAVLRFRVAYRATDRSLLHPRSWTLALRPEGGQPVRTIEAYEVSPPDLKSGDGGDFWEDDWDYAVRAPSSSFLANASGLVVRISGPDGAGEAIWDFGSASHAATSDDSSVALLGTTLSIVSLVLFVGLILSRPDRRSIR